MLPIHLVDLVLVLVISSGLFGKMRLLLIDLTLLVLPSILCGMKISGLSVDDQPQGLVLVLLGLDVFRQLVNVVLSVRQLFFVSNDLLVEVSSFFVSVFYLSF